MPNFFSLSHVLSIVLPILSKYDTKISRFLSLHKKKQIENCQTAINSPNQLHSESVNANT